MTVHTENPPTSEDSHRSGEAAATGGTESRAGTGAGAAAIWRDCRRLSRLVPSGRSRVVGVVLAVMLVVGAIAHITIDRLTALPEGVVLRVADTTVTQDDFRQRIDLLTGLYGVQAPADGPGREAFERDAAQAVAVSMVIEKAAEERHVVVPDTVAQQALDQLVAAKFPLGGRADFVKALATLRVSEQDVLHELTRQLTSARLFDDVTTNTPAVTDNDVANAYNQRHDQLVIPEKRRLRNIVVDTREKADAIAKQAGSGTDFAALASSSSMDKSTANSGGDLGDVSADQLEKPVADAAFGIGQGAVYGPVQSRYGWNVGKVESITPAVPLSLDQVKDRLKAELADERKLAVWRPWLTQRIHDAHVVYADQYRPTNPDKLPELGQ